MAEQHATKYSALTQASSRYGFVQSESSKPMKMPSARSGSHESLNIDLMVLHARAGTYDYTITGVPIEATTSTSMSCVAGKGFILNVGMEKISMSDQERDEYTKKRKMDSGKTPPKHRFLPAEEMRQLQFNGTEMRINVNKQSLESSLDIPSDIKQDKDASNKISAYVCGLLSYGAVVTIMDTDPVAYRKKEKKDGDGKANEERNPFGYTLNARGIALKSTRKPGDPPIETCISTSPFYQAALFHQIASCRQLMAEDGEDDGETTVTTRGIDVVRTQWKMLSDAFLGMDKTVHPRQPDRELAVQWYHALGYELNTHLQTNGVANIYKLFRRYMAGKGDSVPCAIVHNPDQKDHVDTTMCALVESPDHADALPEVFAFWMLTDVDVNSDNDVVSLKMAPTIIHPASEAKCLRNEGPTSTTFVTVDGESRSVDVTGKMFLAKLGSAFGKLPKVAASAVAKYLERIPFTMTIGMPHSDPTNQIDGFMQSFNVDMATVLKQRAIRVSEEWVKATVCGGGDSFPQFDKDDEFEYVDNPRVAEEAKAIYTSLSNDLFACPMTSMYDSFKKINKERKKIADPNSKLCYGILPLVDLKDVSEVFQSITPASGTPKIAYNEECMTELIRRNIGEDDEPDAFFKQCKGIVYAFITFKAQ